MLSVKDVEAFKLQTIKLTSYEIQYSSKVINFIINTWTLLFNGRKNIKTIVIE